MYYVENWINKVIQEFENQKQKLENSYAIYLKNTLLRKKQNFNYSFKMPLLYLNNRALIGEDLIPEEKLKQKTFYFSQGTITGHYEISKDFTVQDAVKLINENINYLKKFKKNLKNPILKYGEIIKIFEKI